MKRLIAFLLCFTLLAGLTTVYAEEPVQEATTEEDEDTRELDDFDEDEGPTVWEPVGPVYVEPDKSEYNRNSPALYTAHVLSKRAIFSQRDTKSPKIASTGASGTRVDVLYVGSAWCIVRCPKGIGYAKRDYLTSVTPVNKGDMPYGVQKATYLATTAVKCPVYKSMSREDDDWVTLNPGTLVTIWKLQDGWGVVPYWRTYGYINMNDVTDLIPVSPTDEPISEVTPIAAYTSYYGMAQTEVNLGRITNIRVACRRLTREMKPHESLDFNSDVGPYNERIGYQPAPVLVNGTTQKGYGGGTCQVSSTLYNALMQLPHVTILQRRPHGPSGAKYLPHGVDAAVGNENLNLRFRNDYDFTIRVEGHTSDDGALTMVVYKVN